MAWDRGQGTGEQELGSQSCEEGDIAQSRLCMQGLWRSHGQGPRPFVTDEAAEDRKVQRGDLSHVRTIDYTWALSSFPWHT